MSSEKLNKAHMTVTNIMKEVQMELETSTDKLDASAKEINGWFREALEE